ncbi:hypothetical protein BDV28DRAFT_132186 [Aspergillus coremiiformis]|uniref:Secreted protein n=1 Tax=Aspergillus coremiiformis TaxID=138285 RepID=A0A5N6ZAM3_9EURO|nr:hypothetical protein BDV28DRAFT_132186 [Aspergillus coremiiformis]
MVAERKMRSASMILLILSLSSLTRPPKKIITWTETHGWWQLSVLLVFAARKAIRCDGWFCHHSILNQCPHTIGKS